MIMIDKSYSVGDVSKLTGLTIRALQHYDNIGVAPRPGGPRGGAGIILRKT